MKLLITHGDGWATIDVVGSVPLRFEHTGNPTPLQIARDTAKKIADIAKCAIEEASVCTRCGELCKECNDDLQVKAKELTEVKDEIHNTSRHDA